MDIRRFLPVTRSTAAAAGLHAAVLTAVSVAAWAAPWAAPAAEAQTPGSVFPDRIEVEVVNVQVWVTDADGRPVVALQPEDFELRVDGDPVPISYFSEIRSDRAFEARRPAQRVPAPDEPRAIEPAYTEPPPALEERSLIIYFDELHMSRLQRKQLIGDLRQMIEGGAIDPARIMIMRQATRLTAEASFGSTRERLDRVLELMIKPPAEFAAPADKRWIVDRIWDMWEEARQRTGRDPCLFFAREASGEIAGWAREASWRSALTADQLEDVAGLLGGVPGVKTLLYVGDSLELTPGSDLLEIVHELCPQEIEQIPSAVGQEELTDLFEKVTSAANASRVTIHSVQPSGLRPGLSGGPGQRTGDKRAPGLNTRADRAIRLSDRSGLEVLAQQTGGRAIFNTNRFDDELEEIARDVGSYYSLGFTPPENFHRGDHKIEVDARHRGLNVRHRPELRIKDDRERLDELILTSIYLGVAPNPLDLTLAHGEANLEPGDKKLQLPLHVRVPIDRIAYLPLGGGPPMASLEVAVHDRSPDRNTGPVVRRTFRFEKPSETAGRADLVIEIEIGPGLHVLGVGVRDQITGEASAVATTLGIHPPPKPETGAAGR